MEASKFRALSGERRGHPGVSSGRVLWRSSNGLLVGGIRIRNRGGGGARDDRQASRQEGGREGGRKARAGQVTSRRSARTYKATTANHNWPSLTCRARATDEPLIHKSNHAARLGNGGGGGGHAKVPAAPFNAAALRF